MFKLFDHLTVCKQMTDVLLNCKWYTAILGNIYLCWLILNWIVNCVSKICVCKSCIWYIWKTGFSIR